MFAEMQLLRAAQPSTGSVCHFNHGARNAHPKMMMTPGALNPKLQSARFLKLRSPSPAAISGQEWPRKVLLRASLGQELSDVDLVDGEDFQLDSSMFEEVFPSIEKVERKPVGARLRGLPTPQSTLIPDDWKPVQQYYHRGKKERKEEALALQVAWAKRRALEDRSTQQEIENQQRILRGQELASAGFVSADNMLDEWQDNPLEVEEEEGPSKRVSGRAKPKDFRSELQFSSFDDIAENLREEELKSVKEEAEEDSKKDSEDTEAAEKEKKHLLTAEERALLKNRKLDFARISSKKWSPLHTLAASGQVYLAAELLKKAVNLDMVDIDGLTPLHRAVQAGRKTMTRMLLAAGANAQVLDDKGATLLHYSAQTGSHEIAKLLLRHGVDANVADGDGWTPLHVAVQSGRLELIKALVYRGADITITNKDGNTALDLALAFGGCFNFYDAIKFLKKRLVLDSESRPASDKDDQVICP